MAGEAERAPQDARLREAVETARITLDAARRREAGPTELRLLTERLRVASDRLRRWRDAHDAG
jgi:hypothetical protein